MDKYKFKKLLKRYQDGTANETERALVEAWYDSYQQNSAANPADNIGRAILSGINAVTQPNIDLPRRMWREYLKVAAAVLLVSVVGLLIYLGNAKKREPLYTTLETRAGEIKRLVLADSSVIWVNASTRLRYPQQFDEKLREVFIDNGEAFFEIKHDANKPFMVHAQQLNVHVLGTSFNINAYKNLPGIKVMVATGKVGITKSGKKLAFLTPGQQITFEKATNKASTQIVDINAAQSWKQGITDLRQATFAELATVMKNQLGVYLKPGNPKVNDYRFTLRIQQTLPVDQTLQMISQIHNTRYRKEGNEIIIY